MGHLPFRAFDARHDIELLICDFAIRADFEPARHIFLIIDQPLIISSISLATFYPRRNVTFTFRFADILAHAVIPCHAGVP